MKSRQLTPLSFQSSTLPFTFPFVSLHELRKHIARPLNLRLLIVKTMLKPLNLLGKLIVLMSFIDLAFYTIQHLTIFQFDLLYLLLQALKLFLQVLNFIRVDRRNASSWSRRRSFVWLVREDVTKGWLECWLIHPFFCFIK